jgi:hypothetical protein
MWTQITSRVIPACPKVAGIHFIDQRQLPIVKMDARQKHSGMTPQRLFSNQ